MRCWYGVIVALLVLLMGVLLPAEAQLRPSGVLLSEPEPDSPPPLPTVSESDLPAPAPPWGEQGMPELETFPPRPTISERVQNSMGMEFVRIRAGSFVMGSPANEQEREEDENTHRVKLTRDYYLQTTEVTQGQWQAVMGSNPSYFKGNNRPVEQVSWNDVQEFIRRLIQRGEGQYRLPTEAEWEYAARVGTTTPWFCGSSESCLGQVAWYDNNSSNQTHPVGQKQANTWGLYDMYGNVWEWVQDWYGNYPSRAVRDPQGPASGVDRVGRGGGWYGEARSARSAHRYYASPDIRLSYLGFRLVWGL